MSRTVAMRWGIEYVERIARELLAKCDAAALAEADGLTVDIDDLGALSAFALAAVASLTITERERAVASAAGSEEDFAAAFQRAQEHPAGTVALRCDTLLLLHAERAALREALGLIRLGLDESQGWGYGDLEHAVSFAARWAALAPPDESPLPRPDHEGP